MAEQIPRMNLYYRFLGIILFINILTWSEARLGDKPQKSTNKQTDNASKVKEYEMNGDYIIVFGNKSTTSTISNATYDIADELRKKYHIEIKESYHHALNGVSFGNVTYEDYQNIIKENGVELIEPNLPISIDPIEDATYFIYNDPNHTSIAAQQIETIPWNVQLVGYTDIQQDRLLRKKRVYVIDSGVANIPSELNIDKKRARNFVADPHTNNINEDDWIDCNGHGTHVAGTIGAKLNGRGVVGVAAGARIIPLRVLDCAGNGKIDNVVAAINYVGRKGRPGDIVNLSISAPAIQHSMNDAIERVAQKGILFSLAAGNGGESAVGYSPARAEGDNIYTVCATTRKGGMASFSNWGRPPVDVCAPGSGVVSLSLDGGVAVKSGTSMAAPHVSGLLVLGKLGRNGFVRDQIDGSKYPLAHWR